MKKKRIIIPQKHTNDCQLPFIYLYLIKYIIFLLILKVVSTLGQGVTDTAHQVQVQAQPHVHELQHSGQAVLHHGKNALQALKDAVTDILRK
jgi:hypothetical protein